MTFNIAHGRGLDGRFDIARIARVVNNARPDIVGLQEVDRWTARVGKLDLITELSERTGLTYAFARTIEFDGGEYGNGVLTRYPILEERHYLFTQNTAGEQRGLMLLVLDIRGTEVVIMNTHFDHRQSDTDRVAAARELLKLWEPYRHYPTVVLGDLNDTPHSHTLSVLLEHFEDTWQTAGGETYPSGSPVKRIDYVLLSKEAIERGWNVRGTTTIPTDASDHQPLVVELQMQPSTR